MALLSMSFRPFSFISEIVNLETSGDVCIVYPPKCSLKRLAIKSTLITRRVHPGQPKLMEGNSFKSSQQASMRQVHSPRHVSVAPLSLVYMVCLLERCAFPSALQFSKLSVLSSLVEWRAFLLQCCPEMFPIRLQ